MTRPLTPRRPKPWRPRPWAPLLALAVLAVSIASSAGVGLRTGARHSVPAGAVSHSVQIVNFAFAPQVITIAAGDSITWTNQDEAPHTVTTTSGPRSISSPTLSKGQSFTYTFTAAGTYSYYCAVHPDMRAQVVVNPAPAAPSTSSPAAKPTTAARPQPSRSDSGGMAHPAAPSTAHSGAGTMPSTGSNAVTSSASSPAASAPGTSAAPAEPAAAPSSAPPADAAAAPAASSGRPLDPALVLAGLTAGATVFCLLLVASRKNEES